MPLPPQQRLPLFSHNATRRSHRMYDRPGYKKTHGYNKHAHYGEQPPYYGEQPSYYAEQPPYYGEQPPSSDNGTSPQVASGVFIVLDADGTAFNELNLRNSYLVRGLQLRQEGGSFLVAQEFAFVSPTVTTRNITTPDGPALEVTVESQVNFARSMIEGFNYVSPDTLRRAMVTIPEISNIILCRLKNRVSDVEGSLIAYPFYFRGSVREFADEVIDSRPARGPEDQFYFKAVCVFPQFPAERQQPAGFEELSRLIGNIRSRSLKP